MASSYFNFPKTSSQAYTRKSPNMKRLKKTNLHRRTFGSHALAEIVMMQHVTAWAPEWRGLSYTLPFYHTVKFNDIYFFFVYPHALSITNEFITYSLKQE